MYLSIIAFMIQRQLKCTCNPWAYDIKICQYYYWDQRICDLQLMLINPLRLFPNSTNFPKPFVFFLSSLLFSIYYVMDTWACIYKNLTAIVDELLNYVLDVKNDLYSFMKHMKLIIAIIIKDISILRKQPTVRFKHQSNVFNVISIECQASI